MKTLLGGFAGIAAVLFTCGVFGVPGLVAHAASPSLPAAELADWEIVRLGSLITLTGSLQADGNRWFLQAGDRVFRLHIGNKEYRKEIGLSLEAGKPVTIHGFVYGGDAAVTVLEMGGREYRFRRSDGTPLWALSAEEGARTARDAAGGGAERSGRGRK